MIVLENMAQLCAFLLENEDVYLMGAGYYASRLVYRISNGFETRISACLVSNLAGNEPSITSIPVVEMSSVPQEKLGSPVILTLHSSKWLGAIEALSANGFRNFVFLSEGFLDEITFPAQNKWRAKLRANDKLNFEIHVADHCNLNCRYCSHFSPIAPEKLLDIVQYEKDLARLSELFEGEMNYINLLGGEPLLNPEIGKIIAMTRQYFPKGNVKLVTNGLLLKKMPEEFWEQCRSSRAEVSVTIYPLEGAYAGLEDLFKSKGVLHSVYGTRSDNMSRQPINFNANCDRQDSFVRCGLANHCIQLKEGKLYTCTRAAYAPFLVEHFGLDASKLSPKDGVDIYQMQTGKDVLDALAKPIPFCSYCDTSTFRCGLRWESSKQEKSDWISS